MEQKGSIFGIHADWQAITLCLIAASTFWFFNAMNDDHTADISYPVEFLYNGEKYVPIRPLPENIHFNATGFGWNLLRKTLKVNRAPIVIPLEEADYTHFITAQQLLPLLKTQLDDIKINYILEDTLFLSFDRVLEKTFPVKVDSSRINLQPGFKITSPVKITPSQITVKGPSNIVRSLPDSFLIKLPESGIEKNYDEEIDMVLPLSEKLSIQPEEVNVHFSVEQFVQESKAVPISFKNFPKDSSAVPIENRAIVTVLIKPADRKLLQRQSFTLQADYKRLNSADSTVPLQLIQNPRYVNEYFITPPAVKVRQK